MWSGSCHFSGWPIRQQQQVQQRPGKHWRQFPVDSQYLGQNYRSKSLVQLARSLFFLKKPWVFVLSEWVSALNLLLCVWISTLLQSELPLNTNNPINDKRTLQTWHKWGRNNRLTAERCQFVQREHITRVRWRDSCRAQQQKPVKTTFTQRSLLSICPHFLDWNSFRETWGPFDCS